MYIVEKINKIKSKGGIKWVINNTIPAGLYRLFDPIIGIITKSIFLKRPIQNLIIIESHNDFDSHGGAFYDYLIREGYNITYKIVWILRNRCPKSLPKHVEGYRYDRISIKRWKYYCVAKYIICGHYMLPSIRKEQISIYTTHGSFSLKKVTGYITIPKTMTKFICPSNNVGKIFAESYSLPYPNDKQLVIGYPAHDILYQSIQGDLNKITDKKYSKAVLWMPTFRNTIYGRSDSTHIYNMGIPLLKDRLDVAKLNDVLKNLDILLVLKIHPMQDCSCISVHECSNIIVLSGKMVKEKRIDAYRLMKDVDALISDYSSAANDFLHLNKPLAYAIDDMDEYKLGFVVDNPIDLMGGNLLRDISDLILFVRDIARGVDRYEQKRKQVFDYIYKYHDGNNCQRLVNYLGLKKRHGE